MPVRPRGRHLSLEGSKVIDANVGAQYVRFFGADQAGGRLYQLQYAPPRTMKLEED